MQTNIKIATPYIRYLYIPYTPSEPNDLSHLTIEYMNNDL